MDAHQQGRGVHLTHAGEIARTDGTDFAGSDADSALEALKNFLTFAGGRSVKLCCPAGMAGDGLVWSRWSPPDGWEPGRDTWFDRKQREELTGLFPGFMARWRKDAWSDGLGEVVYWYVIANDSTRGIDAGLVAAQTALERLSYEVCVSERQLIGDKGFRRKWSGPKRLEELLKGLDIPIEIPRSAYALRQAARGGQRDWTDAPKALTAIRNDLVHGGRRRSCLPPECYIEAWKLAVWFVEMGVLSLCGYEGRHRNRNSGRTEEVPWALAFDA